MFNRLGPLSFMVVTFSLVTVAASAPWKNGAGWSASAEVEEGQPTDQTSESDSAISAKSRRVVDRIQQKTALAREVVVGRLTLLEAAARFRQLHAGDPLSTRHLTECTSEDELYCRNVINFVRYSSARGANATDGATVAARLEEELQTRLFCEELVLPPVR